MLTAAEYITRSATGERRERQLTWQSQWPFLSTCQLVAQPSDWTKLALGLSCSRDALLNRQMPPPSHSNQIYLTRPTNRLSGTNRQVRLLEHHSSAKFSLGRRRFKWKITRQAHKRMPTTQANGRVRSTIVFVEVNPLDWPPDTLLCLRLMNCFAPKLE